MGLFDSFKPETQYADWKPQGRPEAWMATVLGFVHIDGKMSEIEQDTWPRMLITKSIFPRGSVADLISVLFPIGKSIGWKELCYRGAAAVPPEDGKSVFTILCELAMCDGDLREEEKQALEALAPALQIEPGEAKKIAEVMSERMKYQVGFA